MEFYQVRGSPYFSKELEIERGYSSRISTSCRVHFFEALLWQRGRFHDVDAFRLEISLIEACTRCKEDFVGGRREGERGYTSGETERSYHPGNRPPPRNHSPDFHGWSSLAAEREVACLSIVCSINRWKWREMRRLTPAQSSHLTTQLYIERVHRRLPTTHASPLVACSLARSTSCLQGQRGWFDPRGSSFEMVPVRRENWERFEYNLYKIINPRNKEICALKRQRLWRWDSIAEFQE